MLGISFPELFTIVIIAMVIIPPKDFPKIIRFSLKTYQKAQKLYYQLLREINLLGK
ncbi:MAG: hypothetical protein VW397_00825 [Candidatus Margulisiibacteriota bacterium]